MEGEGFTGGWATGDLRVVFKAGRGLDFVIGNCESGLTFMILVFEGEAHPYKVNLIKFDGKGRVKGVPATKTATLEAKPV